MYLSAEYKEYIKRYLDKTFRMSFNDYTRGVVYDTLKHSYKLVPDVSIIVEAIFSLSVEDSRKVTNEWWDEKEVEWIKFEMSKPVF